VSATSGLWNRYLCVCLGPGMVWYECVVSTRVGLLIRLELNCLTDDDDDHDDDVGDIESEFRSRVARAKF